ncbi:MAG: DNA polymerase III subunit epsilon [Holosporales bacterium]|jgi:DNA polymerase-3 subunit epsilon|nr:DNA polymerase III subunit epsilon [Holosporales bacterium]
MSSIIKGEKAMREIALDTETTGLSFSNGNRITEIGCVEIINKKITKNSYHVYINPETDISEEATEISGLTFDFLKSFNVFKDEYKGFLDFIGDSKLVIHNAAFDVGFLNHELSLVEAPRIQNDKIIDTLAMAREKYPGSPATLDALCRRFSVDTSKRTKHGALIDAELLAEVYICMSVELLQIGFFGVENSRAVSDAKSKKTNIKERVFTVSQEELDAHRKCIEKISNPLWERL